MIRIAVAFFLSIAMLFSVAGPAAAQASGAGGSSPVGAGGVLPAPADPGPTGDEILAGIQAAAAAANDAAAAAANDAAAAPAAVADEVLGTSVTADTLAFTGGSVNTPLALGSVMIGAGGLLLLAARKREQHG